MILCYVKFIFYVFWFRRYLHLISSSGYFILFVYTSGDVPSLFTEDYLVLTTKRSFNWFGSVARAQQETQPITVVAVFVGDDSLEDICCVEGLEVKQRRYSAGSSELNCVNFGKNSGTFCDLLKGTLNNYSNQIVDNMEL